MDKEDVKKLAESHVDWYLSAIRPQLIDHMIHGYKHGYEDCKKEYDSLFPNHEKGLKCPYCNQDLNILYLPKGTKIVKHIKIKEKRKNEMD